MREWRQLDDAGRAESSEWSKAIGQYLEGEVVQAAEGMPLTNDHQKFAAAMLWLESGDSQKALQIVEELQQTDTINSVMIAAAYWQQQLSQYRSQ